MDRGRRVGAFTTFLILFWTFGFYGSPDESFPTAQDLLTLCQLLAGSSMAYFVGRKTSGITRATGT